MSLVTLEDSFYQRDLQSALIFEFEKCQALHQDPSRSGSAGTLVRLRFHQGHGPGSFREEDRTSQRIRWQRVPFEQPPMFDQVVL